MGLTGSLRETDGEGIPNLEYLEGLEDGVILMQEDVLRKLKDSGVNDNLLEQIRLEFTFRTQQIQRKKTLTLDICLAD